MCRSIIHRCTPSGHHMVMQRSWFYSLQKEILYDDMDKNPDFGIVICDGKECVVVHRVNKGVAQLNNLKQGDEIHSINGLPCYNKDCVVELLKDLSRLKQQTRMVLVRAPKSKWKWPRISLGCLKQPSHSRVVRVDENA